MANISRRKFLKQGALASAGTLMVPAFLKAFGKQAFKLEGDKIVIMVQFSGGNDGLNTIVPYRNDDYYRLRPAIGIKAEEVHKLDDAQGLHPSMAKLKGLYDNGHLALINSVGYPNPNRSHFRSMDIWHTASDANEYLSTGWLGRYLDAACEGCSKPYHGINVDDKLQLALKGTEVSGLAMRDLNMLNKTTNSPWINSLANSEISHAKTEGQASYLYKTLIETVASAEHIRETASRSRSSTPYPGNPFGKAMKTISELITSGLDTKVYYASLGGFDTHVNQPGQQARLLGIYAEAMDAFATDMKQAGRWKDVIVVTFSEFGRRVKENASRGTDHGKANNLILLGGGLKKPGIYNPAPDLQKLDDGDIAHQVDFRRVYAEVLEKWLGMAPESVLGKSYPGLGII